MHTIKRAAKIVGVHPNTYRNRINPASPYYDPTCPKPVTLGDFPNAAQRILPDELEAWLTLKKEARKRN